MLSSIINNTIGPYLEALAWVGQFGALVQPASRFIESKSGIKKETFPISCTENPATCFNTGAYKILSPNSNYKSVVFFESNNKYGISTQKYAPRNIISVKVDLTLKVWLNLKKLGYDACEEIALPLIDLLGDLKFTTATPFPISSLKYAVNSLSVKKPEIFSGYTFYQDQRNLFLYPYEVFSVDMTLKFSTKKECLPALSLQPEIIC